VYAAQRQGGPHEPIETIMAALDAHAVTHGPIDTGVGSVAGPAPTAQAAPSAAPSAAPTAAADGAPVSPPAAPPQSSTPAGDFNLDDL